jgi:hypothetical protein
VQKEFELEIHGSLSRKDSDADLSPCAEARPLVSKVKDNSNVLKHDRVLTPREIATYGFYLAPLWFFTEVRNVLIYSIYFKNILPWTLVHMAVRKACFIILAVLQGS